MFPGTYNNRDEPDNLSWDAGFRVNKAKDLTMIGNVVAGELIVGAGILNVWVLWIDCVQTTMTQDKGSD